MLFVGAYWSARTETHEEAAARVADFLRQLSTYKPFSAWFPKAKAKAEANVSVAPTKEGVAAHLRGGRRDTGEPMPEVGFSLGLWNGAHASLRVTIAASSPHVLNAAVISFGPEAGEMDRAELEGALNAAIRAFEPDHAVVTSNERMARAGATKPWEDGIFTYERGSTVKVHDAQT
jgi:hypothetical protein